MTKDRICKGCHTKQPIENFSRNKESKDGHRWKCMSCMNVEQKIRRNSNIDKYIEAERIYYHKNKERLSEYNKNRRAIAREKFPWQGRAVTQRNYKLRNQDKYNAWSMKRYASLKNRTVVYSSDKKISLKYRVAKIMTNITGTPYHVDHIIPLQGKFVSGLHHEENLSVIKGIDNLRKNNNFTPCFIEWEFIHAIG